jgi:hypothetical protein
MNEFEPRDRVRVRVGRVEGTVIAVGEPCANLPVEGTNYTVQWDGVDYTKYASPVYKATDLVAASLSHLIE